MFGILIDIDMTAEQAEEIRNLLQQNGFVQQTGGFFLSKSNEMTSLFYAINDLCAIPWLMSARNIHAFRVEEWSDFTPKFKK